MKETRQDPSRQDKQKAALKEEQAPQKSSEVQESQNYPGKVGCSFCGLKNHTYEDCKRRAACELCGYNNHNSYECRREPLWNLGPDS
jgi:hypothetical protein